MDTNRTGRTLLSLLVVLCLALGAVGVASAETAIDTSEAVALNMYVWGDPPVDKSPFEALNTRLQEKINATLDIVSLGWDSTQFDLLFSSGEAFDMVYVGAAGYSTSVRNGSFLALDDLLPTYAPEILAAFTDEQWSDAKVDGKIYAVPFRFTEFIPGGVVYRGDLLKKYGLSEISSLDDLEAYFALVKANEPLMTPFAPDTGWAGWYFGEMYINLTQQWIPLEIVTGMMFAAESVDQPLNLFYPAFNDEFVEFAKAMKDFDTQGYWSKDILSSTTQPYNEFVAGKAAAYFQHAQGYIGTYGGMVEALPGCDPLYYCFSEAEKKVLRQPTMANATAISVTSRHPERALMALNLLLCDQDTNRLVQYGIQGKNYDIDAEGRYIRPAGFDESKDSYSVGTWNLNTDEFALPSLLDYPGKAELNAKLDAMAQRNPYSGFGFDPTEVSNEVAAVNQVNSELGLQILTGKVDDPVAAVERYREQLKAAGIEKIQAEVVAQLTAFFADK